MKTKKIILSILNGINIIYTFGTSKNTIIFQFQEK